MINEEEKYYNDLSEKILNEGFFSNLLRGSATVLGYSNLFLFACLGGALLGKSAGSKDGKINKWFRKIFRKKPKDGEEFPSELDFKSYKKKPATNRELEKAKEWEEKLPDLFNAIENKDWEKAKSEYQESRFFEDEELVRAIAIKIVETCGEPPLFVYPSGNEVYFNLKKVLGIKYAKAITDSVIAAMKTDKSYYDSFYSATENKKTGKQWW